MRGNRAQQHGVSVWRCLRNDIGSDIAAGARTILHNKRAPRLARQLLPDEPCVEVRAAARRERDDQAHRPFRVGAALASPPVVKTAVDSSQSSRDQAGLIDLSPSITRQPARRGAAPTRAR